MPTYYPDVTTILGRPVYRTVEAAAAAASSSPGEQQQPLDCVDVFRRPADVPGHVADVIAARPRVVWLQSGIRCPEAEVGGWLGAACGMGRAACRMQGINVRQRSGSGLRAAARFRGRREAGCKGLAVGGRVEWLKRVFRVVPAAGWLQVPGASKFALPGRPRWVAWVTGPEDRWLQATAACYGTWHGVHDTACMLWYCTA